MSVPILQSYRDGIYTESIVILTLEEIQVMWSQHYATAEETTTAVHCYAAGRVGNAMVMILGTVLQTHDTRII